MFTVRQKMRRGADILERGEMITMCVIYSALFLWAVMLIVNAWPTWWGAL